jgi:folate-binding protein YgfZ
VSLELSLRELETAAGAVWSPSDSTLPLHFGHPERESAAAQTAAALFDRSTDGFLEITGADRARFLHSFCTSNIRDLPVGEACEAFITNVQGKVLGHVWIAAGTDSLWLQSAPGTAAGLLQHLSRYHITEDLEFHNRTGEWGALWLVGPDARARLEQVSGQTVDLAHGQHAPVHVGQVEVVALRLDVLGQPGLVLRSRCDQWASLWQQLQRAGAQPAGTAVFDALRIGNGYPEYGRDITDANLAQEVGRTKQAISFTKGCYLGQEPIARIDALGHVNQELRRLRLEAGEVPPAGCEVFSPDSDKPIGRVTSGAYSFVTQAPVALAYLRRGFTTPGTSVVLKQAGRTLSGTVDG